MDKSVRLELDNSIVDDHIQKCLDAALPLVKKAKINVEKGELEATIFEKQDGRCWTASAPH